MATFADLDQQIAKQSLLLHPFYVKWTKGELTREDLQVYAKEYYHLVARIPGIVERVAVRAKEDSLRAQIEQNAREEHEHVALWERFAKSLGIQTAELQAHVASDTVQGAVAELETLAEGSFEDGLVAMYALEAELPAIARTKMDGLKEFYGLTSEDAQIYFEEHLKEEKHLAVWRAAGLPDGAEVPAARSLAAQNRVLDAVCEEAGIAMAC